MLKKNIIVTVASIGIIGFAFSNEAVAHEGTYKVQAGDSLWKIATANGINIQNLIDWNQLGTSTIYVGQTIKISAPITADTYTVQPGDSLWKIATSHKMTVAQLKEINQLTTDAIFVGQVLQLSTSSTPAPPSSSSTYVVKSLDSLWKVATDHNLTVAQLKEYNDLATDTIFVGQVLKLAAGSAPLPEGKPSLNIEALIGEARKYIGVPYVWGGSTPAGFDCSGYLNFVFSKVNVSIPRTVATIWRAGKSVSTPQRGDIVFFNTTGASPSHAGIFLGDNKFIHAGTSTGVTISDLNNSYWKPRYVGAKSFR